MHRFILYCIGLVWLARLLPCFSYSATWWRGKRFETAVHVVFSGLWAYLSFVFILVAMGQQAYPSEKNSRKRYPRLPARKRIISRT